MLALGGGVYSFCFTTGYEKRHFLFYEDAFVRRTSFDKKETFWRVPFQTGF